MFRSTFVSVNRRLAAFGRDEAGAMVIFGLMLFTLMFLFLGMAIDFMKAEHIRVRLANTLDRGNLAAAAIDQDLSAEAVVRDYVLKAGLADQLKSVEVAQNLNERVVTSAGSIDTKPWFLPMMGIERLDVGAISTATQAISNVEIVLVLDVSGSMAGQKLVALKEAAREFVDTVKANDSRGRISIAVVPYNAQVNIGTDLKTAFTLTKDAGVADVNCVEVPDAAFAQQAIPRTLPMPMMAYADIANATSKANVYVAPDDSASAKAYYDYSFCKPTTVNVVRLPDNDAARVKARIDALTAGGNTSITLGMKWGATLLDPTMRSAYDGYVAQGKMPAALTERPYSYEDERAMKVVVLMTDGEHVAHNRVTDDFKTGASPLYKGTDGKYSVRFTAGRPAAAGANQFYVPHLNAWQATAWSNGAQQDWATVWSQMRLSYVAWHFYARALGNGSTGRTAVYNEMVGKMQAIWHGSDAAGAVRNMDASLQTTCDQARANGVRIYGVTVEAPQNGVDVITACAGTNFTFVADRDTVRTVFRTIASNVTQLRLTQ